MQSDDLIRDAGIPIRLKPFYESGKAKWVGFIWKEMYLNPAFLGSLFKRAGVNYKSMVNNSTIICAFLQYLDIGVLIEKNIKTRNLPLKGVNTG